MFSKLLSGVFWSGLSSAVNTVIVLTIFVFLAITLGPRPMGLVGMAMVFAALANRVVSDEIADGLLKKRELESIDCHTMFWVSIAIGSAAGLLLFISAGAIANLFGEPQIKAYVQVLSLLPFVNSLSKVPKALLRRDFNFRALTLRGVASNVAAGIVSISLALSGFGGWSLILFHLFSATFMTFAMWISGYYSPRFAFDSNRAQSLVATAYLMSVSRLLSFLEEHMPRLLIGLFAGATALGIFMLAWNILVSLRRLMWSSLNHVLAVHTSQSDGSDMSGRNEHARLAFTRAVELPALLALPVCLGLAALAPVVFAAFFGDAWKLSADVVENLSFGVAASLAFIVPLEVMRGTDNARIIPIISTGAIISAALLILISSSYGLGAIATALSIHFCLVALASVFFQSRALEADPLPIILGWLRIAAAAAVMAVVVRYMLTSLLSDLPVIAGLTLATIVGIIIYGAALFLLARPSFDLAFQLIRSAIASQTKSLKRA